jgi:hypothetical protein
VQRCHPGVMLSRGTEGLSSCCHQAVLTCAFARLLIGQLYCFSGKNSGCTQLLLLLLLQGAAWWLLAGQVAGPPTSGMRHMSGSGSPLSHNCSTATYTAGKFSAQRCRVRTCAPPHKQSWTYLVARCLFATAVALLATRFTAAASACTCVS